MPGSEFSKFLHGLHRRMLIVSALDRLCLFLLLVSVAGVLLFASAVFGFLHFQTVLISMVPTALAILVVLACRVWPSVATAAAVADHQLHLHDLLTTALYLRPVPFDDLSTTVLTMADARCRVLSPSRIVVRGFNGRIWIGTALACISAITLACIAKRPGLAAPAGLPSGSLVEAIDTPVIVMPKPGTRPRLAKGPEGENESKLAIPTDSAVNIKSPGSQGSSDRPASATSDAGGGGIAASESKSGGLTSAVEQPSDRNDGSNARDVSGGGGESQVITDRTSAAGGLHVKPRRESQPMLNALLEQPPGVHSGEMARHQPVPAAYRDLARAYFRKP